jgi:hypothetical protein
VGLGARYCTAFGPLRLELATLLHQTPRPLSDPGLYQPRSGILTQWPELAFKAWLLPASL